MCWCSYGSSLPLKKNNILLDMCLTLPYTFMIFNKFDPNQIEISVEKSPVSSPFQLLTLVVVFVALFF